MGLQSVLAMLFSLIGAPFAAPLTTGLTQASIMTSAAIPSPLTSVSLSSQSVKPSSTNSSDSTSSTSSVPSNRKPVVIMAIGGSSATGWGDDVLHEGYLMRAISSVSSELNVPVRFWNESIGGYTPERLSGYFARLLKVYRPNIVIISWGLLDDLGSKTPENSFNASIRQEVALSIQSGSKVWIVTPPATEASYSVRTSVYEQVYAADEIRTAESVNPADVQVFDLLNAMKQYLARNNLNIKAFSHDGWHPNGQGYILAGQLLSDMVVQRRSCLGF